MPRKILVFDTTLRDGEQVPGAKLNLEQKLEFARQLKALHVDIIEAGFPSSSQGDFEAVSRIAREIKSGPMITALARAVKEDIDAVYQSVRWAEKPLIHIVLGASAVHVEKKFARSKEAVLDMGVRAVRYAKSLLPQVQYSTEDASRADFEYLWQTIEAVVKAGATMINIPDTVGYAVPEEFGELIRKINDRLKNLNDQVILSVHCHNDTGLATANTLIAVKNGATKVECTINGLGERAGNSALEEVVMGLKIRSDYYDAYTDVVTQEIYKTSKMLSGLTGLDVQVNKALTGENAFAHSSGIHQDGLLKSRDVYEIISPEDVGVENMELILTARSGRHAFKYAAEKLGYQAVHEEEFEELFVRFLKLADLKKEASLIDIYYLIKNYVEEKTLSGLDKDPLPDCNLYEIISYQVISSDIVPAAAVKLKRGQEIMCGSATGDGPIDALYTAIRSVVDIDVLLKEYKISSISMGKEAQGKVSIKLIHQENMYSSRAVDQDIIKASALAYIDGINAILLEQIGQ